MIGNEVVLKMHENKKILSSGRNPGTKSSRTELLVFVRRPSTHYGSINWGVVQLVRASVLYTGSRGFKSRRPNNLLYLQYESQKARDYKKEYAKYGKRRKSQEVQGFSESHQPS